MIAVVFDLDGTLIESVAETKIYSKEGKFLKVPTEHRDVKPVEIETSTLLLKLIRDNASYISMKQEAAISLS